MPSSLEEPSPSFPIYIPGRRRMCSRQSSDLILDSLYSSIAEGFSAFPITRFRNKLKNDTAQKINSCVLKSRGNHLSGGIPERIDQFATNKTIFKISSSVFHVSNFQK